jgi:hypothetical protein
MGERGQITILIVRMEECNIIMDSGHDHGQDN